MSTLRTHGRSRVFSEPIYERAVVDVLEATAGWSAEGAPGGPVVVAVQFYEIYCSKVRRCLLFAVPLPSWAEAVPFALRLARSSTCSPSRRRGWRSALWRTAKARSANDAPLSSQ